MTKTPILPDGGTDLVGMAQGTRKQIFYQPRGAWVKAFRFAELIRLSARYSGLSL
jgi:hypothetical protein